MAKIILFGALGDRFVKECECHANTLKDAINYLFCMFPDFKNYLLGTDELFHVSYNGAIALSAMNLDEVKNFPINNGTVVITPVIEGSGSLGGLIGGLALVGIGVLTGGTGLILAGIALGLQSVFLGHDNKKPDNVTNYVISSSNLNTAEGNAIPIVCGHILMENPQVISFKISSTYTAT